MPDASPLFYCPVCPQTATAWLHGWQRDAHMRRCHPEHREPVRGSGLDEWRKMREELPASA